LLDEVPQMLRTVFKSKYNESGYGKWNDDQKSGDNLLKIDSWSKGLFSEQETLLKKGNTSEWDLTLLTHVLLYSSMCLLAKRVVGTRCIVTVESDKIQATDSSFDFIATNTLKKGDGIILYFTDNGSFCYRVEQVEVTQFVIDSGFKLPKRVKKNQLQNVELYIKLKSWEAVDQLRIIRNKCYGHRKTTEVTKEDLDTVIDDVKSCYEKLDVPTKKIEEIADIKNGT